MKHRIDFKLRKLRLQPSAESSWKPSIKAWLDIIQGLFTIGAFIAAAFWFLKQESLKPQIKLEQTVTQRPLDGKSGEWLVAVDVRITNVGKVKVDLGEGKMYLKQINPVPGEDLAETPLKEMSLDPGEVDQAIFKTFEVPDYIRTIQVSSTYGVPKADGYYWELISAADVGDTKLKTTSVAKSQ